MVGESESKRRRRSKPIAERLFPISRFGLCAVALWPSKPALALAQRVGCTERAANLWIAGHRRPSARAVLAIANEID